MAAIIAAIAVTAGVCIIVGVGFLAYALDGTRIK